MKKTLLQVLLCFLIPCSVYASCSTEPPKCSGLSEEQCQLLVDFKSKICDVEGKKEAGWIKSAEVKAILGEPDLIGKESIKIRGQKKTWTYWHPCAATVRFILIFNKDDELILMTSVQNMPAGEDKYYALDYFLE